MTASSPMDRGPERGRSINDLCNSAYPLVMGIVNVTPDSFYDGGRFLNTTDAVQHALKLEKNGAGLIDIGGESSRPGAEPVSLQQELDRVIPVIESVRQHSDIVISIDTYKSEVAREAVEAGAQVINDIAFGTLDPQMFQIAAKTGAFYVGMHMQGKPRNMQENPVYGDVVEDVAAFLHVRAGLAQKAGISPQRIILDPGIGFGKTDAHNIALLRGVPQLRRFGYPVLIGASRKSMIGRLLGLEPEKREAASLAIALYVAERGADIIRVHDVLETRMALDMWRILCE